MGRRSHAVEHQPGPRGSLSGQRLAERLAREQSRRINHVDEARIEPAFARLREQLAERSGLFEARRQIGLVGPGQMAEDTPEMECGLARDGFEQRQRVFPRNAGPAHPGIDFDVDAQRPREIPGRSGQRGHLPGVKDGRGEIETDGALGFPGAGTPPQYQDGFADARVAEFGPLGDGGHRKPAATRLDEGARHPGRPVPVRVRLDDGHHLARFGASPGLGKIGLNRPEVDRRSRRPPAHSQSPPRGARPHVGVARLRKGKSQTSPARSVTPEWVCATPRANPKDLPASRHTGSITHRTRRANRAFGLTPAAPRVASAQTRLTATVPEQQHPTLVNLLVNGDPRSVPLDCTVAALIDALGLQTRRIAIAVNREVVPRSAFATHQLAADDRVEILEAVGGG